MPDSQETDRHYKAMLDSVSVVDGIVAEPAPYLDSEQRLRANVEHLEIMLGKDWWDGYDLTLINDAVSEGNTRLQEIAQSGVERPRNFTEEQARLYSQVKSTYSRVMSPIAKAYPAEEREGWAEQVQAAQEVLAGGQNDLIDALRAPTGETAAEMAQAIIAKRQEYLALYGSVTAARRGLDAQIAAATTLADLDAINVHAAFGI